MEPIAIIGIGCRFPGARDPEAFWQLLSQGVDAVTAVPASRWDAEAFYHPDLRVSGKMNSCWGGFLEAVDQFDFHFFKILPWEAIRLDPQQRLLLEVAWEALEDAGQVAERLAGTSTGVFIGIAPGDYGRMQLRHPQLINASTNTGNLLSIAANRISYFFDFRGPSIALDTACSSSLVAVHLACQSLWCGESALALAGGVNVIISPELSIGFSKTGALSPDGRCKAFDAQANGYVRGEGAGMVVLKPLCSALTDHDPIYAVIRGSAVNNDGRTNGLTAPNRWAQEAVLREAYRRAGISPGQVQYVEAHGTGTILGDQIEAAALGSVIASNRPSGQRCAIGSVKTNIGHLETAAGVASLIKVALSLKHREIPPSLHFREPNPHIPFNTLPLQVQQVLSPWPETSDPAIAGVSSFGFGGTNAHVVLEEAPPPTAREPAADGTPRLGYLLPLSAHSSKTLWTLAQGYRDFLASSVASLQRVSYTTSVRRSHHHQRLALVGHCREELIERLDAFLQGEVVPGMSVGHVVPNRRVRLAFMFPSHDPPGGAMGRDCLQQATASRMMLQRCDALLRQHTSWSLVEALTADTPTSCMDQPAFAQPVLFAVQVSLAALWRSWGIEPDAVVGHGVGEVAAAHVAGALSLDDAMQIAFHQGRLRQQIITRGGMAAGARSFAGLESVQRELLETLRGMQPRSAALPIFSAVTGRVCNGEECDAPHWARQLEGTGIVAAAIDALVDDGYGVFLELSPRPVLAEVVAECLRHRRLEAAVLPSLGSGEAPGTTLLESLGTLYSLGYSIDWGEVYPAGGCCVHLPSYPWQRERCWLTPEQQV